MKASSLVLLGAVLLSATPVAAQQLPKPDTAHISTLGYFVGSWSCSGEFPSNGRKITSRIRFDRDVEGTALVKHHDDTLQPAIYHAIEVWTYAPAQKHFVDTITDNFGGVRMFTTSGWDGDVLTWSHAVSPGAAEQFVYTKLPGDTFRLDYRTSRNGAPFQTIDTLTCAHALSS